MDIAVELQRWADPQKAAFLLRLTPGCSRPILGVRMPHLRGIAKKIAASTDWKKKLQDELTDATYEEVMLRGLTLGYVRVKTEANADELLAMLAIYVPLINSWGLCDSVCATFSLSKHFPDKVWQFVLPYLHSTDEYPLRFGIVMLWAHFINDTYINKVLAELCKLRPKAFYAQMALAWAWSEAFVKYPKQTMPCLVALKDQRKVYRLTLQKIKESRRLPESYKVVIDELQKKRKTASS